MNFLVKLKLYLMSLEEPATWIFNKRSKTVLDVGCGQGIPMKSLNMHYKFKKTVGVDLFDEYLKQCKKEHIHTDYVKKDVRKISYKQKSFDTVMCLQVVEHLTKKDAWKLVEKMEKIAKRQIIIATPIGHLDHDEVDHNHLQLHKSFFYPEEFEKKGYAIVRFGRKELYGNNGLVHKLPYPFYILVFFLNFLLIPVYKMFPSFGNYHFYAYKNLKAHRSLLSK